MLLTFCALHIFDILCLYLIVPAAVENINDTEINSTSDYITVNISWNLPCDVNGPLNHTLVKMSGISKTPYGESDLTDTENFTISHTNYFTKTVNYYYSYTVEIWLVLDNLVIGDEAYFTFSTRAGGENKVFLLIFYFFHKYFYYWSKICTLLIPRWKWYGPNKLKMNRYSVKNKIMINITNQSHQNDYMDLAETQ